LTAKKQLGFKCVREQRALTMIQKKATHFLNIVFIQFSSQQIQAYICNTDFALLLLFPTDLSC